MKESEREHIGTRRVKKGGGATSTSLARPSCGGAMLHDHRFALGTLTLIEIEGLPDRRLANAPQERWLFGSHVERALYGSSGTGAFLKLLGR